MRQTVDNRSSKTSKSRIAVRGKFVGRYARLRIPRAAMRHTEDQLVKLVRALDRWNFPPVVIGDKGEVLAGFGQAQVANRSIPGRGVWTTKYSELTHHNIRDYIQWMKQIARRGKWERQMLVIELQHLQNSR